MGNPYMHSVSKDIKNKWDVWRNRIQ